MTAGGVSDYTVNFRELLICNNDIGIFTILLPSPANAPICFFGFWYSSLISEIVSFLTGAKINSYNFHFHQVIPDFCQYPIQFFDRGYIQTLIAQHITPTRQPKFF